MSKLQSVFITGGSSGIGQYLAFKFLDAGYNVSVSVRSLQDRDAIYAASNNKIKALIMDVTDPISVSNAIKNFDSLDILINNAGIANLCPLEVMDIEWYEKHFEVNVIGALRVTQAFLPLIRKSSGKVIFMGSMCLRNALPFIGAYSASKAALQHVARAFRLELKPWNIGVYHIEAGTFPTPILDKWFEEDSRLMETLSVTKKEEYIPMLQHTVELMKQHFKKWTNDPAILWKVVHKISRRRQSKFNHIVGKNAWIQIILKYFLPDRLIEKLIAKYFMLISKKTDSSSTQEEKPV